MNNNAMIALSCPWDWTWLLSIYCLPPLFLFQILLRWSLILPFQISWTLATCMRRMCHISRMRKDIFHPFQSQQVISFSCPSILQIYWHRLQGFSRSKCRSHQLLLVWESSSLENLMFYSLSLYLHLRQVLACFTLDIRSISHEALLRNVLLISRSHFFH